MTRHDNFVRYLRKSTDDNHHQILSLESQEFETDKTKESDSIFVLHTFRESRSAKLPGRPEFAKMMEMISRGGIDGILCWRLNRLARNLEEGGQLITALQLGRIKVIRTCEKTYTSADILTLAFEFGVATVFSADLAANIRKGREAKLRRGAWPGGNPPPGYIYDRQRRNLVPHPKLGPAVTKAFEAYAGGTHTLYSLTDFLFKMGIRTTKGEKIALGKTQWILRNQIYVGIMKWAGVCYEGKYEPLVTPKIFSRVHEVMIQKGRARPRKQTSTWPFRGLFRCPCGAMVTSQFGRGHGGTYRYYRCSKRLMRCGERYIQEDVLARQIQRVLAPLVMTDDEISGLERAALNAEQSASREAVTRAEAIHAELTTVQARIDKLVAAYVDETIDEDSYYNNRATFLAQKVALKAEKTALEKAGTFTWFEPTRDMINTLKTLAKMEKGNDLETLSQILLKVGSNLKLSAQNATFDFAEPYDFVASFLPRFRSHSQHVTAHKTAISEPLITWCLLFETVRTWALGKLNASNGGDGRS